MHNIIDEKFWLAIAFIAFAVLIFKYVWPSLSHKISDQSKLIAKELLAAQEMKEKAQRLLVEAQEQKEATVKFSKTLIEEAKDEAQKFLDDSKKSLADDVAKKVAALENRIKSEEERMIREIKAKIVSVAVSSVQDSLQNTQKNRLSNVVKNSISDISKIIH